MKQLNRLLIVIGLTLLAVSGFARAAAAQTWPGKIAFASTRAASGASQIYVMNGDGSSQTNLSNNGNNEWGPVFNRLGTKILYESERPDLNGFQLCTMDADGSNQRILATALQVGLQLFSYSFSPDGSKIVCSGYAQPQGVAQIHTMNADGTGNTLLATGYQATYSADGTKILFIAIGAAVVNPLNGFEYDLLQMNTDGTGQVVLVHNVFPSQPSFSSDGSKIAFVTDSADMRSTDINVMNADGTGRTIVATGGFSSATKVAYNYNPTFSPDGASVAFESSRSIPPPGVFEDDEIWSVNVDGSNLTQLTFYTPLSQGISSNRYPSYGPGAVGMPVLVGLSLNPTTVISGNSALGTVTLSGPAPVGGATVFLSSASPNAGVPSSITVPAGTMSATFPIATTTVPVLTVANITAAYGLRLTAPLTLNPPDTLAITRAEYTLSQKQLKLQATSTSLTATLTVYDASTGALIGTMTFAGGGKYQLQTIWPTTPLNVTIRSTKGGSVTGPVTIHN